MPFIQIKNKNPFCLQLIHNNDPYYIKMSCTRLFVVFSFVVMAFVNIVSTTTNLFNHTNNTIISKQNPTSLTPDGITFAIWGPIYLFEFFTLIQQCSPSKFSLSNRKWLSSAFLLNAIWLPTFAYGYWWLSLFIISAYLWSLQRLYDNEIKIDYGNHKLWRDKVGTYIGISMNMAWVVVATLLNVTIVFRNSKIVYTTSGNHIIGGNADWAIACVVVATTLATYKIFYHADIFYGLTTVWALFGIHRNQTNVQTTWAYAAAITLLVFCTLRVVTCFKRTKRKKNVPKTNVLLHRDNP